ncbi:hypothetical protein NP233_g4294 [Leucocoprinus birnbaumii]|uniref:Uncharacterized protein n=1 Tax=Leucocoprinus birnbaumii TaxID=56174 RepID=A0AAD5VUZ5_9AGAR|nr:hypothetical protein NP233_g4294 [Leucocoprinus birnbaumii]
MTAEAEKDDLKDSVLELVEKGLFDPFLISRIAHLRYQWNGQMTFALGPSIVYKLLEDAEPLEAHPEPLNEEDQLAYAGAIIERLRRERDNERVAHSLTRDALQSRVDILEAQLARREAELEFYATHTSCVPTVLSGRNDVNARSDADDRNSPVERPRGGSSSPNPTKSKNTVTSETGQPFTDEAVLQMLNATAARNRTLKVEIKTLFKQLQQARSISSPSSGASAAMASPRSRKRDNVATPRAHTTDSSPLSTRNVVIPYDINDYEIEDQGDLAQTNVAADDSDDRVHLVPRRHIRTRDTGSSRTRKSRRDISPSGQALYDHCRPNRRQHRTKRRTKSRANTEVREGEPFSTNRHQGLGTNPLRVFQSAATPVSDTLDDHHSDYDDDGDAIWRSVAPASRTSMSTSIIDAPSAQEHINLAFGTSPRAAAFPVSQSGDASASDSRSNTSLRRSISRSTALGRLDEAFQELTAQLTAAVQEREELSKVYASYASRFRNISRLEGEEDTGSPTSVDIPRALHDNQSATGGPGDGSVIKGVTPDSAASHGNDEMDVPCSGNSRKDTLDSLAHRLGVVEQECLVTAFSSTPAPFQSDEHDERTIHDPHTGAEDQSAPQQDLHRQSVSHHETSMISEFDSTPGLVPESTGGVVHQTPRLLPQALISDGVNPVSEIQLSPPSNEPSTELADPARASPTTRPQTPSDPHDRWLRLNDTELDGLLDAIDGEASMELATPLTPTTLLDLKSPSFDSVPRPGSHNENLDENADDRSDHDDDSREILSDNFDDLDGVELYGGGGLENDRHRRANTQAEFISDGDEEDGGGLLHTGDVGRAPFVAYRGAEDFFDDSPFADGVNGNVEGRQDFHVPSAPLLRKGEREGEFDDIDRSAVDDGHQQDGFDYTRGGSHWADEHHDDGDNPSDEQYEGRGETEVFVPQFQSQFQSAGPPHPAARDIALITSTSNGPGFRPSSHSPIASPTISEEALHAELILERAERELSIAEAMLEQGESALRSLEASLSLDFVSPPHSPTT